MVMLLVIFLYAVLGKEMFAKVRFHETYNENANFRDTYSAIKLLVRSMTGEGWNEIMHDLSHNRFYFESYLDKVCVDTMKIPSDFSLVDPNNDGTIDHPNECGSPLAYVYFISYTIIVTFVVLNLFIAVIFEGWEESQKSDISDLIAKCVDSWRKYDPDKAMLVPLEKALDFIDEVVADLFVSNGKADNPGFAMESRWDPAYCGQAGSGRQLPPFSLHYMRVNGLSVNETFEVRFICAVKAVLRRIIVQGGLSSSEVMPSSQRLQRLRELEALDSNSASHDKHTELEKELDLLYRMERKQARAIQSNLNPEPGEDGWCFNWFNWSPSTGTIKRLKTMRSSKSMGVDEHLIIEEVAAAKIQRRFKDLMQKRRERLHKPTGTFSSTCGSWRSRTKKPADLFWSTASLRKS